MVYPCLRRLKILGRRISYGAHYFSNSSTVFHFEINCFEVTVKEMCYRKSCFCASRVPNWPRNEFYVNWVSHCTGSCARRFSTQKLRRPSLFREVDSIMDSKVVSLLLHFPKPNITYFIEIHLSS